MTRDLRIRVSERIGEVSALLEGPESAEHFLVLAHGAGAGMRHAFLERMAERLAAHRVATLRYQFPYTERGSRRPDPPAVLEATVRAAVAKGAELAAGLPLFAGGKSMGGRMTSRAQAAEPLPEVRGLVFLGFPLHPAGKPGTERADHLAGVRIPMLFLQGTRDDLADLDLLRPICARLPNATLAIVVGADHSFKVPKASERGDDVLDGLAATVREWISSGCSAPR
ncbi:MAG: alpha/beta hydrolase family protein [Candidatus Eiseniibacteriota bacterium]